MTPRPTNHAFPMSELRRGSRGLVAAVQGSDETVERLAALGVVPGVAVRVLAEGSPMTVALGEARFALGRGWAESVLVIRA